MNRLFASVLIAALLPIAAASTAQGASETVWQYSPADKTNPTGISATRDIRTLTLGIYPDPSRSKDRFQFFIEMGGKAGSADLSETSFLELFLDTNLDKVSDFSVKFVNKPEDATYAKGQVVADCETYIWATGNSFATSFNMDCITPQSEINVSSRATSDGMIFDQMPDNSAWQKFKTKYMQVAACNSSSRDKKVTYSGTTFICLKTTSKYVWADYGPIAAKTSKWLTEKAYYLCNLKGKFGVTLEDGGKTLSLDGVYKYFISEKDYDCVTKALSMPASVTRRIGFTRALDGMQEAKWGKLNSFWNYHPDSGLNITFSYN